MAFNFKNIIKNATSSFSRKRVFIYVFCFLIVLFIALLMWDMIIFLSYYRIAVEPQAPITAHMVKISEDNFKKALDIIGGVNAK